MNEVTNIEDWVVQRFRRDLRRVAVVLGESDAAAPWLAKLRRLLPELEVRAPAVLLEGGAAERADRAGDRGGAGGVEDRREAAGGMAMR
jgi:hypothetical protein